MATETKEEISQTKITLPSFKAIGYVSLSSFTNFESPCAENKLFKTFTSQ